MTVPLRDRPSDRRLKRVVAAITIGALALLVALRAADLWWWRAQLLDGGRQRAENQTRILAEYVRGAFAAGDASLRQLAIEAHRIGGARAPDAAWAPLLGAVKAALVGVGGLTIVGADGVVLHSTQTPIVGLSRRDESLVQESIHAETGRLLVGTPILSQSQPPKYLVPIGQRLTRPDGAYDGMVVVTFVPDELRGFFGTLDVGRQGALWVFHPNGIVLFHEPSDVSPAGESAAGNPVFEAARLGQSGTLHGRIGAGGAAQISAYHSMPIPPLIVAVSLSETELLAAWRRELTSSIAVFAGLGFVTMATLLMLYRQIDARAAAEQALARAQRLESIGRLTGGVAHDFNNMLTVILGNASLLKDAALASHQPLGELEQIEHAAERAAALTHRLLAFARRQPLLPERADLNGLVRNLHPMLARLLGEQVAVRLTLADSACVATVDVAQVESAIMNLCLNARDAMPQGGLLSIATTCAVVDAQEAHAELDELAPGRYVIVAVADTGVGIPPEDIAHVFEPFFTTKPVGAGTGLGLSMVYGLVKQSGGHVKVDSERGRGTTVTLFFPQSPSG